MEFRITIKDELGIIVCEEVPFDIDMLEDVSKAAGGLEDFIKEYQEKLEMILYHYGIAENTGEVYRKR